MGNQQGRHGPPGPAIEVEGEIGVASGLLTHDLTFMRLRAGRRSLPPAREGAFVKSSSNDLGIGKWVGSVGGNIEIEYFDTIAATGRHKVVAPASTVRRTHIPTQTRCYFEKDGVWQVGRVIELLDDRYSIFLPNEGLEFLKEQEFHVRWNRPVDDPCDNLIANGLESPGYHELREPFMEALISQRAACRGITAISSAVVSVHLHQLDTVCRVLMDHRQRFLLADEVGLGKTIEAGLIIRQVLLDDPAARVVVCVPRLLVAQWSRELQEKFLVDDFEEDAVLVVSHEELDHVSQQGEFDMLVVDEAHDLMPESHGLKVETGSRYATLRSIAHRVPGLLLLSATPLLHNEVTFLGMLHLLDPDVYELTDLESFRRRVVERQELALRLNAFKTSTPAFLLRRHIDYLRSAFHADSLLDGLLADLSGAMDSDDHGLRGEMIESVQRHLADTYRLHRRVLRHRRGSDGTDTYHVRGRAGAERLTAAETTRVWVNDWLDDWRLLVLEDHGSTPDAIALFVAFLQCAGSDLRRLVAALHQRLGADRAEDAELLEEAEVAVLRTCPVSEQEAECLSEALRRLEGDTGENSRLGLVVDLLGEMPGRQKAIVFAMSTGLARSVEAAVAEAYGRACVASHMGDDQTDFVEAEVERFRSATECQFLICDSSAEAGRNLQWADRIFHLDVPWSPNRLEQRLGRVDRLGSGQPVPSFVFVDGVPGSFTDAWIDCLTSGFRVFGESIATLQHAVDAAMGDIGRSLLERGLPALQEACSWLPDRLSEERDRIIELDTLESVAAEAEFGHRLFDRVVSSDAAWHERKRAVEAWLCTGRPNLRFYREKQQGGLRRYVALPEGRPARAETLPLIPWDILDDAFMPLLDRPGTYSRTAAQHHPGARLFAVGEPFIDALLEYSRSDGRGQCYGMWRCREEWIDRPELIGFRMDFIVMADIRPALAVVGARDAAQWTRALQRRCDAFLDPMMCSAWIDHEGNAITDEGVLDLLNQRFGSHHRDFHLSPVRRPVLDRLVRSGWEEMCRRARTAGEEVAAEALDLRNLATAAGAEAARSLTTAAQREQLREAAGLEASLYGDLAHDGDVVRAMVEGIKRPRLIADSMGCVVLASYVPEGWGDE
jgi:ATP-dependent helicase HepA